MDKCDCKKFDKTIIKVVAATKIIKLVKIKALIYFSVLNFFAKPKIPKISETNEKIVPKNNNNPKIISTAPAPPTMLYPPRELPEKQTEIISQPDATPETPFATKEIVGANKNAI